MSLVDIGVYLLGPVLILLASAITFGLTYTFFYVMLPMLSAGGDADGKVSFPYTKTVYAHIGLVFFLLTNVVHNYVLCVTTRNNGPNYDRLVRELAEATGFRYPETDEEKLNCRRDYEQKLIARGRARRDMARQRRLQQQQQHAGTVQGTGTGTTNTTTNKSNSQANGNGSVSITMGSDGQPSGNSSQSQSVKSAPVPAPAPPPPPPPAQSMPGWMLMDANEWGYCLKSNQPKPPRSHYDHVTKCLILNMDHYCPWMFNVIGYFNYRYFCNFLFYVFTSMVYGTILTLRPFRNMNGPLFRQQVKLSEESGYKTVQHMLRLVPTPEERTAITFAFMLCLSIGIAISVLGGFHLYLMLSAQTTIEFHGNFAKRRGAARRGTSWSNPYSLGWKKNWQLVYGSLHPLLAILPSSREPEFLPIPISGELGRRQYQSKKEEGLPLVSASQNNDRQHNGMEVSTSNGGTAPDGTLNKRRTGAFAV